MPLKQQTTLRYLLSPSLTSCSIPFSTYLHYKMSIYCSSPSECQSHKSLILTDLAKLCEMIGDFLIYDIQLCNPFISQLDIQPIPKKPTRFHSSRLPAIPLGCYLKRIAKTIPGIDSLCLVLIVVYYRKLKRINSLFEFDLLMLHRFVAAIICVASKFNSDYFYSNSYYAKVCGVTGTEMNLLEVEFLLLMEWNVIYTVDDVENAIKDIKSIDCNV